MKKIRLTAIAAMMTAALTLNTGCDDLFDPAIENHKDASALEELPAWAVGMLGHAYISNPLGSWSFNDVATDDAVSNDPGNSYRKMATGSWRSNDNPMDRWQHLRASWQYINQFIEVTDKVNWAADPLVAEMFKERFKGDAYGMRALYMYHLLLNHAGVDVNGQLSGVPILLQSENLTSDFNLPRNTFKECIDQLNADADLAISMLPEDYGDITDEGSVPAKYKAMGVTAGQYTRVFGDNAKNRMSAKIARAIKAQAALLAASPAYAASGVTWEEAANRMADVLNQLGPNPISQLDPNGNLWYVDGQAIEKMEAGYNSTEMLWRANKEKSSSLEKDNYPPTIFGKGRINPTQNLVDAFPTIDGYPISESDSYDESNPYAYRDPRLKQFILVNGEKAGPQNTVITTAADGTNNDALNKVETSTRTGYYMKKLLCQSVNANPNSTTDQYHIKPFIRYTEIFLGYAEAANEAWGPTGTGTHGYSAYDVIKAIRKRAGIGLQNGDAYLESIKTDKNKMRELIRNERRLELCFEGFRFWDLRRWKAPINEAVKGIKLTSTSSPSIFEVEKRSYADHMYYGPIPYNEVLKFSNLLQNQGW